MIKISLIFTIKYISYLSSDKMVVMHTPDIINDNLIQSWIDARLEPAAVEEQLRLKGFQRKALVITWESTEKQNLLKESSMFFLYSVGRFSWFYKLPVNHY